MGSLLKILSFAVDVAKGISSIFRIFRRKQVEKKDEKEESELEKIIK